MKWFALALPLFALSGGVGAETFTYQGEWRLMHAGQASLQFSPGAAQLTLKTTGFVGSLYHVDDRYTVSFDRNFCASRSFLNAEEGSKRLETRVTYNEKPGKAELIERDLKRNVVSRTNEVDVPPCVHDVIAALARLRSLRPNPGDTLHFPISDGKKSIQARIVAHRKEIVKTPAGAFTAQRFEAFLFNGILYRRKGRLFIWLSDDDRRLPVQIRIQMPFYIGTVTLQLMKEEES